MMAVSIGEILMGEFLCLRIVQCSLQLGKVAEVEGEVPRGKGSHIKVLYRQVKILVIR